MNTGDNAYCKKTYIEDVKIVFKKNKSYPIFLIDEHIDSENVIIWLYCEKDSMPHDYCGCMYKGELYNDFKYFSEFFATEIKEIRKIKLTELKK